MKTNDNPNWFARSPLTRLNTEKDLADEVKERLADTKNIMVPLWRGDPLVTDGQACFLSVDAAGQFPPSSQLLLLGEQAGTTYFAIDASSAEAPEEAPFADIGTYMPIREAAALISRDDLAIVGQARWLFEWHRLHAHCARCGGKTIMVNGGAKRQCQDCSAEHFPRTDPVAIVLAINDGACLLGRGPHFPPGFLSALAGFVEAAETPEEAAKRELFEEAGVTLTDIRYQFSQPWPFPNSLMMGFIADTVDRSLTLDRTEIEEARWIDKADIVAVLGGETRDFMIPPKFTIARQLLERWAG